MILLRLVNLLICFTWKKMSLAYKKWILKISKEVKHREKDWKQSEKITLIKINIEVILGEVVHFTKSSAFHSVSSYMYE